VNESVVAFVTATSPNADSATALSGRAAGVRWMAWGGPSNIWATSWMLPICSRACGSSDTTATVSEPDCITWVRAAASNVPDGPTTSAVQGPGLEGR
jgi:hypothetical protein